MSDIYAVFKILYFRAPEREIMPKIQQKNKKIVITELQSNKWGKMRGLCFLQLKIWPFSHLHLMAKIQ